MLHAFIADLSVLGTARSHAVIADLGVLGTATIRILVLAAGHTRMTRC